MLLAFFHLFIRFATVKGSGTAVHSDSSARESGKPERLAVPGRSWYP